MIKSLPREININKMKFLNNIIIYFLGIAISHSIAIKANTISEVAPCNAFTIDKCKIDPGGLLETVKDISVVNCQFYCNVIYGDVCTFFIYDYKEVLCEIITEPFENYVKSCGKYAGPPKPSISECYDSNDECKVILILKATSKHPNLPQIQ